MEIRFEPSVPEAPAVCLACGGLVPAAPVVPILFTRDPDGSAKPVAVLCSACLPDGATALMEVGHSRLVGRVEEHAKRIVWLLARLRECESLQVPTREDYRAALAGART